MILLMNFGMTIPVMGSFFAVADGMMAHEWASILGQPFVWVSMLSR